MGGESNGSRRRSVKVRECDKGMTGSLCACRIRIGARIVWRAIPKGFGAS